MRKLLCVFLGSARSVCLDACVPERLHDSLKLSAREVVGGAIQNAHVIVVIVQTLAGVSARAGGAARRRAVCARAEPRVRVAVAEAGVLLRRSGLS